MTEEMKSQGDGLQQKNEDKTVKTYTQEELDKLIQERSDAIAGKVRAEEKKKFEAQRLEAEEKAKQQAKFEKMSELEQKTAIAEQATKELQELKDKIALGEQKEETRKLMKEKGLDEIFLDSVLVFKDADATVSKIDEMKKVFDDAVQKALEGKIKTHVPKDNGNTQEGLISEEDARNALGLKKRKD